MAICKPVPLYDFVISHIFWRTTRPFGLAVQMAAQSRDQLRSPGTGDPGDPEDPDPVGQLAKMGSTSQIAILIEKISGRYNSSPRRLCCSCVPRRSKDRCVSVESISATRCTCNATWGLEKDNQEVLESEIHHQYHGEIDGEIWKFIVKQKYMEMY